MVRASRERAARFVQPGAGASAWTIDATSGRPTPLTEAEAEAILSAALVASPNVTNLWKFGTPASGDVSDVIGGKTLTASAVTNSWTYQQSESGWALKFIQCGDPGLGSAKLENTSMPNVNANSYTLFLLAKVSTPIDGVQRTICRLGGTFEDDANMTINNTPILQIGEGDGTYTSGASDPTGAVRWFVLRIDDTGNTVDAFTSQEKIIVGTQACNGTEVTFGGDFVDTWRPPAMSLGLAFIHQGALTNTEIKAALTSLGESPGWTP